MHRHLTIRSVGRFLSIHFSYNNRRSAGVYLLDAVTYGWHNFLRLVFFRSLTVFHRLRLVDVCDASPRTFDSAKNSLWNIQS